MRSISSELYAAGEGVWDGVTPSFGPFAGLLETKIGIFLSLAWLLAFFYVAYQLIVAIARTARARQGSYGEDLSETKRDLLKTAAAAVGLAAAPAIWVILVGDV